MEFIFNKITLIVSGVLFPFQSLPPVIGLAFLALVTAVFALLVYKTISNQAQIKIKKKRIFGHFFGIYLSRDELGLIIKEFIQVLRGIGLYLAYLLPPLLVVIVPVLLLCAQIQVRYGYDNLRPGDQVNVTLSLAPDVNILQTELKLETSDGVAIRTPALRIQALKEVTWRVEVKEQGDHTLTFTVGDTLLTKNLRALTQIDRIYPVTEEASFFSILAMPGDKTIPTGSNIISARIDYPERDINLLGLQLHWTIAFLILTLAFGLLLKKPLKVNF